MTYYERPASKDTSPRERLAAALFTAYTGDMTLDHLHGGKGYVSTVLNPGAQSDYVLWLQARLAVPVQDRIYGSLTTAYVKAFQSRYRLVPDGIAGPITLGRLGWSVT